MTYNKDYLHFMKLSDRRPHAIQISFQVHKQCACHCHLPTQLPLPFERFATMSVHPSTTINNTPTLLSTTIKPSHCSNTTKPNIKTSYNAEKSRLFVEKQKQSSQAWLCGTGTSFYCTRQGDDFGLFENQKAYHDEAIESIRADVQSQDNKRSLNNKKTFETAVRAAAGRYNADHRWAKVEVGRVFYDCSPSAQLFVCF